MKRPDLRSTLLLCFVAASVACGDATFPALSAPAPLTIGGAPDPAVDAVVGERFALTLEASGGEGQLAWAVASGALPPGLALSHDGGPSARIAGSPTEEGQFHARVEVSDAFGGRAYVIICIIVGPRHHTLEITTASVAPGQYGQAYLQAIDARGGSGLGYEWSVIGGRLPAGLTLSNSGTPTALVYGVPTETGTIAARIRVADSLGATAARDFEFSITQPRLTVVTSTLARACPASTEPYSVQLRASGGTGTGFSWSLTSGALPPGLSLAPSGLIWGYGYGDGRYDFDVRVMDSAGNFAGANLGITVSCSVSILDGTLPTGTTTSTYSHTLRASGGLPPYTWRALDRLPSAFRLETAGRLVGTSSVALRTSFRVEARDALGNTGTRQLTLQIVERLVITTGELPWAAFGAAYDQPLAATGGVPPYVWSGTGLPAGFAVLPVGRLIGTSTSTSSGTVRLLVRDSAGLVATATRAFSVIFPF